MDINSWLTVVSIFLAVLTFLPKENREILHKRMELELYFFGILNMFVVPYLIYFKQISEHWTCLQKCTFSWGFKPENIAFVIFYISFLWLLFRLKYFPASQNHKDEIQLYEKWLIEKPFNEFFKTFTKYTSVNAISENWNDCKPLLFHSIFLKNILDVNSQYLLQFFNQFKKDDFQTIFRLCLNNPNSEYYSEIKEHWNSYDLLPDKPFLNTVIKDNLKKSIDFEVLQVFTDYVAKYIQTECKRQEIYNQKPYHSAIRKDEGFDLPLNYHIQFIGLLYTNAIRNKVDISTLSNRHTNMNTIYSSMLQKMIDNITTNDNSEYPTNYHWLICQIFEIQSNWLREFKESEFFDDKSSYVDFIPLSLYFCLSELYTGLEKNKISIDFFNSVIYHNILTHYFSKDLQNELRNSIEEHILKEKFIEHQETILEYALEEEFAISYTDFMVANEFSTLSKKETEILIRLRNKLK